MEIFFDFEVGEENLIVTSCTLEATGTHNEMHAYNYLDLCSIYFLHATTSFVSGGESELVGRDIRDTRLTVHDSETTDFRVRSLS